MRVRMTGKRFRQQRDVASDRQRERLLRFFILQAVFFAGMILCGLYVGIRYAVEQAKKEAYMSAQKSDIEGVTQETYVDAGLRQAERMLLSLKESLSEKETRRYNIMQDMEEAKQPEEQERELLEDIRALELAAAEIDRLSSEYYEESLDELGSAVSKWMSQLTAGHTGTGRLQARQVS